MAHRALMTANELQLTQCLKDALAMLRWQAGQPLGSSSWATWSIAAVTAIDDVEASYADTQVFTGPFTRAQLRKLARVNLTCLAT